MSTPAESHINELLAPLFVEGDGMKFLTTAFQPDVEWTLTSPGGMGSGSHSLTGTYKGLEAIGNVFWQLDQLFGKLRAPCNQLSGTDSYCYSQHRRGQASKRTQGRDRYRHESCHYHDIQRQE